MTPKDTASIREVYSAVSEMRSEMKDMEKRIREDFKASMDAHCKWAEGVVKDAYKIADEHEEEIKKVKGWQDNLTGKITIIGAIMVLVMNFLFDFVKEIFAKGVK